MATKSTRCSLYSPTRKSDGRTTRYVWIFVRFTQYYALHRKERFSCVAATCFSLPLQILPLYFPRNKAEQYRAAALLPKDVGNESGETVVAERQVRVGESYQGAAAGKLGLPAPTGYEHDEWLEPETDPTVLVGGDGGSGGAAGGVQLARYLQLLEASKEMDLKAIVDRQIIYRAGKDSTGLPVRTTSHF